MKRTRRLKRIAVLIMVMTLAFQVGLLPSAAVQASENDHVISIEPNAIVQTDFLGVGVNAIPVSFMEGTSPYGYNEAHWEMDRKRIIAMQPKVARVWFQIDWMEPTKGNYTWDSPKMLLFYQYLDALKEAGTEVEFNFGWKVGVDTQSWFSIPGVDGRISAPADLDAYAASTSAVLNELINNRGYTNIKYLTFYNEPNGNWDFESLGDQKAYYATMVQKASDRLTADGLRHLVQIWGPEESGAPDWTQYMKDNADAYFDAYTFHVYGQSYDGLSTSIQDRTSVAGGKPVVVTEFGFAEDKSGWEAGLAGTVIKAANEGLHGALIWQLNGVWLPDPYVGNDTNGNYTMWDSLVLGTDPYKRYYEASLLTRYIPAHSTVISADTGSPDVRAAAFKTDDGDYTIVLETSESEAGRSVTLDFNGIGIGKTFYKHEYRDDIMPEGNAIIPQTSGSFAAGASFTDSNISSDRSVIVYTTLPPYTQVAIDPLESVVTGGQSLQLSADVIDQSGGVTWSVYGAGNGSVTSSGLYTAPHVEAETLVAVKAASVADPDSYGIAFVKVIPASTPGRADIPILGLPPGKYASAEAVTIASSTEGAEIRYTLDGSTPTEASTLYTGPVFLYQGTQRVKAVAFKDDLTPSAEAYGLYKIASTSSGPDGYQFCAYEDGFDCSFEGTASVAFGADGLFNYATLTDGTACSIAVFGDPNSGQANRCYFSYDIPSEPPVVTIYNAGFERPDTANYTTGPLTNGWAFNFRSGVQHNGSAFGAVSAPEGEQTAFMVSRAGISGELIQTMNFKPGTYALSFQMAARGNFGVKLPFDIYLDDTLIGTYEPASTNFTVHTTEPFPAEGYHTIKFIGQVTEAESTVFIDDVKIKLITPPDPLLNVVANAGFEEPDVRFFKGGPMVHGWTFNQWSGIQRIFDLHDLLELFGHGQRPEEDQTALMQSMLGHHSEISQSVVFDSGLYTISFDAAKLLGKPAFELYLDDRLLDSYEPSSRSFTTYTTERFVTSAGRHTIKFVGAGGQWDISSAYLDDVKLDFIAPAGPPLAPSDVDVTNAGFELPYTMDYISGPMTHGWTFNEQSGVQINGSVMAGEAAPEGIQTAFLQSADGIHGEIGQSMMFEEGHYVVSFDAAKQASFAGTLTFSVFYDDELIGSYAPTSSSFAAFMTNSFEADAGAHTIKFVGTSSTGDSAVFIDAVTIKLVPPEEPASRVLLNSGFEDTATVNYLKGPMTHGWTFNERAGFLVNGSVFGSDPAPEGDQAGFVQSVNGVHGEISQRLYFDAGTYAVQFQAAKRTTSGGTLTFHAYVDDELIGVFTPASGSYAVYQTDSFTVAEGNHTIRFVGATAAGDNTSFIDAVIIQSIHDGPVQ